MSNLTRMRPEARAMAQQLLKHHRQVCKPSRATPEDLTDGQLAHFCIRYGVLCELIGTAYLTRSAGGFLHGIAEWCERQGWPPINALVVNASGLPGEGYDRAPGGGFIEWPDQVRKAISYQHYPESVPDTD